MPKACHAARDGVKCIKWVDVPHHIKERERESDRARVDSSTFPQKNSGKWFFYASNSSAYYLPGLCDVTMRKATLFQCLFSGSCHFFGGLSTGFLKDYWVTCRHMQVTCIHLHLYQIIPDRQRIKIWKSPMLATKDLKLQSLQLGLEVLMQLLLDSSDKRMFTFTTVVAGDIWLWHVLTPYLGQYSQHYLTVLVCRKLIWSDPNDCHFCYPQ